MYVHLHPSSIVHEDLAEESVSGFTLAYPIARDEVSLRMVTVCPSLDDALCFRRVHEQDDVALLHDFIAENAAFSLKNSVSQLSDSCE